MDLSKVSTRDLKKEISKRDLQEKFKRWNTVPGSNIPYKAVKSINDEEGSVYSVYVNDGCEGLIFLVKTDYHAYKDEDIIKCVQHYLFTELIDEDQVDENGYQIDSITIEEINGYGPRYLLIESQKEHDE